MSRLDVKSRQALAAQLLAPRYTVDAAGRLEVEPKDQTKKRGQLLARRRGRFQPLLAGGAPGTRARGRQRDEGLTMPEAQHAVRSSERQRRTPWNGKSGLRVALLRRGCGPGSGPMPRDWPRARERHRRRPEPGSWTGRAIDRGLLD